MRLRRRRRRQGATPANELIISIHVPKTGGESFRDILEEAVEGRLQRDYGDKPDAPLTWRKRLELARSRPHVRKKARAVHGHFIGTKYWREYPEARYMAWLRDPVERLVSHYQYWQRKPDKSNPTCRLMIENDLSMEEFAALREMRNLQTRYLGEVPVSALAFVGITERYDESIELFRRAFAPDLDFTAERTNANPGRSGGRYEIDQDVRSAIAALNTADADLHARGQVRFEELLREYGMAD